MNTSDSNKIQRNLTALIEFSRIINTSLDLDFTLNNLLFSCFGKFLTSRGFVGLFRYNEFHLLAVKGLPKELSVKIPASSAEQLINHPEFKNLVSEHGLPLFKSIESGRKPLGVIALGEKINKAEYTQEEEDFLQIILNLAATSIENSLFIEELKVLNRQLDGRLNSLSSLFELSKEFGSLMDEERISKLLIYSLLGNFMMSGYAIIYHDDKKTRILESTFPKASLMSVIENSNFRLITSTKRRDELIKFQPGLESFKFALCVPLQLQGETKGCLLLGERMNKAEYSERDIEFIYSVGGLAISSLENKRLFKEALEKQKLEEELQIAKEIQKNLLPKSLPKLEGFEFAAESIPSKQIGGDYYDVLKTGEDLYTVAIADVSGKGVPAALLMANLQAFLKATSKQQLPISDASGLINNLITENTGDGRFITFFWFYFNSKDNAIRYVNAGHNPPILVRDHKIQYLDKGGIIFGVAPTLIPYHAEEAVLQKGDCLVLFTDGVTEAKNEADDEYTDERLENLVLQNSEKSAAEMLKIIKDDLQLFVKGTPQSDDITLVILKVQ